MKYYNSIIIIIFFLDLISCNNQDKPIIITSEDYFESVDMLTQIMVHDIFSPPVASRNYVYPFIASYEIIARNSVKYQSLYGQISELPLVPISQNSTVNIRLSALIANIELSKNFVFSEEKMIYYRDSLYAIWKNINNKEFEASKNYAFIVIDSLENWIKTDKYHQTRTMPKFYVDIKDSSRWQPTPPAYMDAIEPHWKKMRPMLMDSSSQFKPSPPPKFSLNKNSQFYKELLEVYELSKKITQNGDSSREIKIAQFWDCNPYVSVTRGHFMFATKKITPGAHWISITMSVSKKQALELEEAISILALTSLGIYDAFISCWDEKYRSNLIRPETLINQYIDEDWLPILQTPPFPEYTSGHSVVSGAASTILTSFFGENFSFEDDSEVPYGLEVRHFDSFNNAAQEAAISRLYGGIHYRKAIYEGLEQGRKIGNLINNRIKIK